MATPEEVSAYLQIPAATLAQWRYQGKGPAYRKLGRHVRYSWEAISQWLQIS